MFGSTVIDIAIGLVFVYLLLSLVSSAVNEIIERSVKWRASDLEKGLKELLRDDSMVTDLYNHPLVYGLFEGEYKKGGNNLPSYIPSSTFALALMDLVLPGRGAAGAMRADPPSPGVVVNVAGVNPPAPVEDSLVDLRAAIQALPNADVKRGLLTLVSAAGKDVAKARENIEGWFNSGMDRVSGWYKRRTQLIILLLGLLLAASLNVDTVAIVRVLSTDRTLRDSLVAAAQEYAKSSASSSASPAASPTASPKPSLSPSPSVSPKPGQTPAGGTTLPSGKTATPPTTASATTPAPPTPGCEGANNTPECRISENLKQIKKLGLPIGWTREENDPRSLYISPQAWFIRIIGWLLTALAVSLGAPFWFDMLNKFIVVRSTVKPKEKSQDEPSKG